MRISFCLIGAVCGLSCYAQADTSTLHDVVNGGTSDWADAARAGRSDMFVIGDSVTWIGGYGWDQGMTKAGLDTFGLAGTGVMSDADVTGQGYGATIYGGAGWNNGWDTSPSSVPADRQGYTLRLGAPDTAGSTPTSNLTFGVSGQAFAANEALDWHVYTASAAGGGSMAAYRRVNGSYNGQFYPVLQSLPAVATATPASGLQQTVFHFNATPDVPADTAQELRLSDTTNTSVLYSRLIRPNAKGITVSSLGYGGHTTLDFYNDIWNSMSADGRSAYLESMVDGGSGKLNIMIAQGLNDRNDTRPSLHNLGTGQSVAGFTDNLTSLIALLRQDWANGGHAAGDLSFTLVGMYHVGDVDSDKLADLAGVEQSLAESDRQISFVDLYDDAASYADNEAAGYFRDTIHPSAAGAQAFSDIIMNAIAVPEPAALTGLLAAGTLAARRRRVSR